MFILMQYIKYRVKLMLIFILFACICISVFSLYELPLEAVFYALALCGFVGMIFLLYDVWRFVRMHAQLTGMQIHPDMNDLPAARNLIEQDHMALVVKLMEDKRLSDATHAQRYSEMLEYYTLWAHQIKTPIAAMQLYIQTEDTQQKSELLEQLFRIEQYVEIVLQYLRLDDMSSDLVIAHYSLDDLVKQAVRKYAKSFIRKKITLNYTPIEGEILTDEKWLTFAIEQLLSNALKYTREGSISIYLDTDSKTTLVIEDTGIGIGAEELPRVFERGFTGYNGRTDKRASGIGLYLCNQILKKLHHTISIESTPGTGTKVKLGLDSADITIE